MFGAGLLRTSDGAVRVRDLSGSDEHKMLRDMCRAFADTELAPNAGKWDKAHEFPVGAIKQMAEMGLMGVAQPTDYGGAGSRPCLPSALTCPAVDPRVPHASARCRSAHGVAIPPAPHSISAPARSSTPPLCANLLTGRPARVCTALRHTLQHGRLGVCHWRGGNFARLRGRRRHYVGAQLAVLRPHQDVWN